MMVVSILYLPLFHISSTYFRRQVQICPVILFSKIKRVKNEWKYAEEGEFRVQKGFLLFEHGGLRWLRLCCSQHSRSFVTSSLPRWSLVFAEAWHSRLAFRLPRCISWWHMGKYLIRVTTGSLLMPSYRAVSTNLPSDMITGIDRWNCIPGLDSITTEYAASGQKMRSRNT